METWREIAGYEGLYAISSLGRIKRLEHWKNQKTTRSDKYYRYKKLSEKILRPYNNGRYETIDLSKDNVITTYLVHRLVAINFIDNPNNLPEVNHKDCNGLNNRVDNLEWCDRTYNINYADRTLKAAKAVEKKVLCVETGVVYDSGTKAANALGLLKSKISQACNGKRATTGGLHWRFVEALDK